MSGFAAISGMKPLSPGLYKVTVPLYWPEETKAVQLVTGSNTAWAAYISLREKATTEFKIRFPRTNVLDPKTGLDKVGGTFLQRKGIQGTQFWVLIAVTEASTRTINDLYDLVVSYTPGFRPLVFSSRSWRERLGGKIQFFKYVVSTTVAVPVPVVSVPTKPPAILPKPQPIKPPATVLTPKPIAAPAVPIPTVTVGGTTVTAQPGKTVVTTPTKTTTTVSKQGKGTAALAVGVGALALLALGVG